MQTIRYYIEFLNKKRGFSTEKKYFETEKKAIEWGSKNIGNFHPEIVRIEFIKN